MLPPDHTIPDKLCMRLRSPVRAAARPLRSEAAAGSPPVLAAVCPRGVYRCEHREMPFRCRDCKKYFSVKTGTALPSSNLPLKTWAWAT